MVVLNDSVADNEDIVQKIKDFSEIMKPHMEVNR